ncbi:MAG: sulfur carrier protein ThiS [Acidobacteriaceae bacterium]|nr:sulfur carrier protein ThiS [Acidobacteriaceae bacterium]
MVTDLIDISINGELREVPSNCCVASLLEWLNIAPDRVAVELNKVIVRKRDWAQAAILQGARIEIVEFVGGG